MSSKQYQRQAVISVGLYQFIGSIADCLAVEDLMCNLQQVENAYVHDPKDNEGIELPDKYWVIQSEPRGIGLTFVGRDETIISELDSRHIEHIKNRKARWDAESESETDETTDES